MWSQETFHDTVCAVCGRCTKAEDVVQVVAGGRCRPHCYPCAQEALELTEEQDDVPGTPDDPGPPTECPF